MKTSEARALPRVHESQLGRYAQEDPTIAVAVPPGDYTLLDGVVQAPGVRGGQPYAAIGFVSGDSTNFVGLRKFRGYGTVGGETKAVVEQPSIPGGVVNFLKTSPQIVVLKTETVTVDRYGEPGTISANYPIWKQK